MEFNFMLQSILALLTAIIHVYIFALESCFWLRPYTRKTFGMSEGDAMITKSLAFNQGFYNLFLAIAIFYAYYIGVRGIVLMNYAMLSILAAGLVLLISKPKLYRGALIQIVPTALYFLLRFVQ